MDQPSDAIRSGSCWGNMVWQSVKREGAFKTQVRDSASNRL